MISIKKELQNMSISELQFICKEMGITYTGNKNSLINNLLFPLKRKYRMKKTGDEIREQFAKFKGNPDYKRENWGWMPNRHMQSCKVCSKVKDRKYCRFDSEEACTNWLPIGQVYYNSPQWLEILKTSIPIRAEIVDRGDQISVRGRMAGHNRPPLYRSRGINPDFSYRTEQSRNRWTGQYYGPNRDSKDDDLLFL